MISTVLGGSVIKVKMEIIKIGTKIVKHGFCQDVWGGMFHMCSLPHCVVCILFIWFGVFFFFAALFLLCLKLFILTGGWDRWTCSDRDPGHQEQWGNTCHERCLSGRWVWYKKKKKTLKSFLFWKPFYMQYITYFTAYKKSMEEAIQSDTSGHFCRILVSLVQVIFIMMRTSTVFNFHAHSLVAVCLPTETENRKSPFDHMHSYIKYKMFLVNHWSFIINNLHLILFTSGRKRGGACRSGKS